MIYDAKDLENGCPECGGELRYKEVDGYELRDGSYYVPNSFIITSYVYKCSECGRFFNSNKKL